MCDDEMHKSPKRNTKTESLPSPFGGGDKRLDQEENEVGVLLPSGRKTNAPQLRTQQNELDEGMYGYRATPGQNVGWDCLKGNDVKSHSGVAKKERE